MRPIAKRPHAVDPTNGKADEGMAPSINLPNPNPRVRSQSIRPSAMHACSIRLLQYMYLPYASSQLSLLQVAIGLVAQCVARCAAPSSRSRLRCWPACSCAWRCRRRRWRRDRRGGRPRSASCRSERPGTGSPTTRR